MVRLGIIPNTSPPNDITPFKLLGKLTPVNALFPLNALVPILTFLWSSYPQIETLNCVSAYIHGHIKRPATW